MVTKRRGKGVRAEVKAFGELLERVLRNNDGKPGWAGMSLEEMFGLARLEMSELQGAVIGGGDAGVIANEAGDVSALMLMMCLRAGGLKVEPVTDRARAAQRRVVDLAMNLRASVRNDGDMERWLGALVRACDELADAHDGREVLLRATG